MSTGFTNSFTSGEICDDAWDRVDIQPVAKGVELASNFVVRIAGPLGKRRGFWLNGQVADMTKLTRLVPFRRSVNDALMLEFGDSVAHVWQANGTPLMNGGVQVSFSTPYAQAQLAGLRWKQVADVIYFRHATGLAPQALTRTSDTSWAFALETFPNGPWLAENIVLTTTITPTGTDEADALDATQGAILAGQTVTLTANQAIFNASQVGGSFRLRQAASGGGLYSWSPGNQPVAGTYALSAGHIYRCKVQSVGSGNALYVNTPPVHTSGDASDGNNVWSYRHDGAGVVLITGYTSPTVVTGTVVNTIPLRSGQATSYWSEGAYSNYRGWPRMWPALREERLVSGATQANLDMLDLTGTAGFQPADEDYTPGTGTGVVTDINAIRRRVGDDGGEMLWSHVATYLVVGTVSGEYLVAGSVLDEPLSPAAVTIKQLSAYGSADVYPARAHKGVLYVTRGNQTLREISVDTSQVSQTDDLTVLAKHIAARNFQQLAWILSPDETLWCRMGDGGMACLVYHQEQAVRGWCTMTMPTGWICEDIQALPGPGGFETLWCVWSRIKNAATQRVIVMQSQVSDGLFMDLAQSYAGAAESSISASGLFEGETVSVVANGAQVSADVAVTGGAVSVPAGTTAAQVGFRYLAKMKSLKLTVPAMGGPIINKRNRLTGANVSLKCLTAYCGLDGTTLELISTRQQSDVPIPVAKRTIDAINIAGDGALRGRDPRIVVQDDSAYDCVIYSIEPQMVLGD